jgi:hypothetical protein
MSGKIVSIAVESDEWDEFEGAPLKPSKDVLPGAAWKQAREDVRAANERLTVAENAVRELLPDDPTVGSTEIAKLDGHICAVLKTHSRMTWDSSKLLTFIPGIEGALKLSICKAEYEKLDDEVKAKLDTALTHIPYERLTFVEFHNDMEVDDFLEHENV